MSVIAEYTVSSDAFALTEALNELTEMTVDISAIGGSRQSSRRPPARPPPRQSQNDWVRAYWRSCWRMSR